MWNDEAVILWRALCGLEFYEEAWEIFEEIESMDPNESRPYEGKGEVLYNQGRHAEALECFQRGLDLDPENEYLQDCERELMRSLGYPN